jgi:hypothetical protein
MTDFSQQIEHKLGSASFAAYHFPSGSIVNLSQSTIFAKDAAEF